MINILPMRDTEKALFRICILDKLTEAALEHAWKESGITVTNRLRYILSNGPRTGRVYTIRGRKHQASAPGEAPARLTGKLIQSVDYEVTGHHTLEVGEHVLEDGPIAGWLEFGTKKMAPRPHLKVAVEQTQSEVMDILQKSIAEAHK